LYNGEIYNHDYEDSDGEVLIPLYEEYGPKFTSHLDGEFSIVLYDFGKNRVVLASDAFGTKPMWSNGIHAASYLSACPGGSQFPPNTTRLLSLSGEMLDEFHTHVFDFDNQHKTAYDDWMEAFENSLKKRASNNSFVCLSSGMDSGVIVCGLERLGICNWAGYSILGTECVDTLRARFKSIEEGFIMHPSKQDIDHAWTWAREKVEPYSYCWRDYRNGEVSSVNHKDMLDDRAVAGLSVIFKQAREDGRYIHLSGHGGDEIYSDYGYSRTSQLRGTYPDNLTPWGNFHGNQMRDYLHKEEHVGGAYGIESRYPLLDTETVQEFLWLTPGLKNSHLKAPIKHYLDEYAYPYRRGKVGFNPLAGAK
jgi:asparagine synthetase B (glutamine-hydrolysing)